MVTMAGKNPDGQKAVNTAKPMGDYDGYVHSLFTVFDAHSKRQVVQGKQINAGCLSRPLEMRSVLLCKHSKVV